MIQQRLGDLFVIFVVLCCETPSSTTGKKRVGGTRPPHCVVELPASSDEGALAELEGLGTARGTAKKFGLPEIS